MTKSKGIRAARTAPAKKPVIKKDPIKEDLKKGCDYLTKSPEDNNKESQCNENFKLEQALTPEELAEIRKQAQIKAAQAVEDEKELIKAKREELKKEIAAFMDQYKGRSSMESGQYKKMVELYNGYYPTSNYRADRPCDTCAIEIWNKFYLLLNPTV